MTETKSGDMLTCGGRGGCVLVWWLRWDAASGRSFRAEINALER